MKRLMTIVLTITLLVTAMPGQVLAAEVETSFAAAGAADYVTSEVTLDEADGVDASNASDSMDTPDASDVISASGQTEGTDPSDGGLRFAEEVQETGLFLTEEEQAIKEAVASHDVVDTLTTLAAGEDYVDSQVIFYAESRERAEEVAEAYGGSLANYAYGIATISLRDTGLDVIEAVRMGADPAVALPAVEPNYLIREEPEASVAEEDEAAQFDAALTRSQSWADFYQGLTRPDPSLHPENEHYQWGHDQVDIWDAWSVTRGSSDITVAVIDTGVLTDHEELKGRVTTHEVSTVRNDGTKRYLGTKPVGPHATHVAGIIAAAVNNGVGGAGIAPGVKILSICVQDIWSVKNENTGEWVANWTMPFDAVAQAIRYVAGYNEDNSWNATGKRAQIINMSLGGYYYNATLEYAVNTAYVAGVTILATTGNDTANLYKYPACYNHVIAVTSVDQSGERSGFATFGKQADIAAPGANIWSTSVKVTKTPKSGGNVTVTVGSEKNYYEYMSGTSMACPQVAGACALYMSAYGVTDPDTMERLLKKYVTKSSSKQIGTGIVDVGALLCQTAPKTTPAPDPGLVTSVEVSGQRTIAPGKSVAFKAAILPKKAKNKKVTWSIAPEGAGATIDAAKGVVKVAADAPLGGSAFTVTATATDGSGVSGSAVFYIRDVRTTAVAIDTAEKDAFYRITRNARAKNTVTGLSLFNADVAVASAPKRDEHRLTLSASLFAGEEVITDTAAAPLWSSSNPSLVAIEGADANGTKAASTVTLVALGTKAGKATITCTAQDGTKKKAAVKVSVTVPVSNLTLTTKDSQELIGLGRSVQVKAVAGNTYGKPTNARVKWSCTTGFMNWNEDDSSYFVEDATYRNFVTVSKSGVVKVKSSLDQYLLYEGFAVQVKAETTDGTEWSAESTYEVVFPVQRLYLTDTYWRLTSRTTMGSGNDQYFYVWYDGSKYNRFLTPSQVTVTSSNPEVAGGYCFGDNAAGLLVLSVVAGRKAGTATLTLQSLEGSKKKTSLKVTVK